MKLFKSLFKIVLLIIILLFAIVVIKETFTEKSTPVVPKPFETTVKTDSKTLKSSLNNMGFLITNEYNYTHAETYEKSRPLFIIKEFPGTKAKFVYSCDGTIPAGVNFEKIDLETEETDEKIVITVFMPTAVIYKKGMSLDLDSFKLLDEERNVFNPITVEEVKNSFKNIEDYEKKKAEEKGLLKKAEDNAKILIENFLKSSCVQKECEVKFEIN